MDIVEIVDFEQNKKEKKNTIEKTNKHTTRKNAEPLGGWTVGN